MSDDDWTTLSEARRRDGVFEQEFAAQPPVDEKFQKAFKFWLEYERDCEFYDRGVCTGPMGRDGIMPADGHERLAINVHAKLKRDMLHLECSDVPPATIQRAKEAMNSLSHQGVLDMLERLNRG